MMLFIVVSTMSANAQKKAEIKINEPVCDPRRPELLKGDNAIFTAVENSAEFKGGVDAFYQYLGKSIHYPKAARNANVQGKVFATFVVEKNGSLTHVRILKGIGYGCDNEAVRVLKASPKWKPGRQNGKIVRQQYTVPITFTLQKA